jgi:hypothetical protein
MGGRRGNLGTSPETLGGEAGRTLWVQHWHQFQQLQRARYRVGMKRHPALPLSSKMRLQPLAAEGPRFTRAGHARRKVRSPRPPQRVFFTPSAKDKCLYSRRACYESGGTPRRRWRRWSLGRGRYNVFHEPRAALARCCGISRARLAPVYPLALDYANRSRLGLGLVRLFPVDDCAFPTREVIRRARPSQEPCDSRAILQVS